MQVNTFFKTLSAATLAVVLAACGGQKDSAPATSSASPVADNGTAKKEIVFGTTVGDFGDMVKDQIQPALEKKGYTIKLVERISCPIILQATRFMTCCPNMKPKPLRNVRLSPRN